MVHYFLIKGGTVGCFRMAAWYAPLALDAVNAALSDVRSEAPTPPVSCAAMLARRKAESDMHVVMASGLAGGVGLCGGACGALGAAIWFLAIKIGSEGGKVGPKAPRIQALIDRFLEHTDYKFECAEIVGRQFVDVADHARHLRDGGCADLIQVLAAG
jgi:hypothetical protein